jgi:hypothetical protein
MFQTNMRLGDIIDGPSNMKSLTNVGCCIYLLSHRTHFSTGYSYTPSV